MATTIELVIKFATKFSFVGSRVTCNPPPIDTDCDWLVLIDRERETEFMEALSTDQWELGGSLPDEMNETPPSDRFMSFTKGEDNIIMTNSSIFYRRFMAATSVAKRLNLMNKDDRIALFQAVLYANCSLEERLEELFS